MSRGDQEAPENDSGVSRCYVCDAPVTMAPCGPDDWMWLDDDGRAMAPKTPFRWRWNAAGERVDWLADENPYRRLRELRGRPTSEWTKADALEYTALRSWECFGGLSLHTHIAVARPTGEPRTDIPDHCGWTMYLAPSGWLCRKCDHRKPAAD